MHPEDLEIPTQTPRELSARDDYELGKARGGFLRLFGFIWGSVGCGLMIVFAVLSYVAPPFILGVVIASPFLVAGLILIAVAQRRINKDRVLLETGRLVTGEVIENVVDYALRKNRKYPNRIVCRCLDPMSNKELTAKVRIWNDLIVEDHPEGTEVPMIIDADAGRAVAPSVMNVTFGSGIPSQEEVAQRRRNRRKRKKQGRSAT